MIVRSILFLVGSVLALAKEPDSLETEEGLKSVQNRLQQEKALQGVDFVTTDAQQSSQPELSLYNKAVTQFDGILQDDVVTYLKLDSSTKVVLPYTPIAVQDEEVPIDFAVQMWFKVAADAFETLERQYLFTFEDGGFSCYFTKSRTFMCDSDEFFTFRKIEVDVSDIKAEQWVYLTISGRSEWREAYVQFEDRYGVIAAQTLDWFTLKIKPEDTSFSICLGDCSDSNLSFNGGIREFAFLNRFIEQSVATEEKNYLKTYNDDIKAYYRFSGNKGVFEYDRFVERSWTSPPLNFSAADYIGFDMIPNDICPLTWESKEYVYFDSTNEIRPMSITAELPRNDFVYTLSVTFYVDGTNQCATQDRQEARDSCNIFIVDEVAMFYFSKPNYGRFHFHTRTGSEVQSSLFFVPYNQWVTVQMTMSQANGYGIVVIDPLGQVLTSLGSSTPLAEQIPSTSLNLLEGFSGYVDSIKLCQETYEIPANVNELRGCPIDLSLAADGITSDGTVINKGAGVNSIRFRRAEVATEIMIFEMYPVQPFGIDGEQESQPVSLKRQFDGIACADNHRTLELTSYESQLSFDTIRFADAINEATVEFWFKAPSRTAYSSSSHIFSFYEARTTRSFMEIFIEDDKLKCSPFGRENEPDLVVEFEEFAAQNEDKYGWWHVSCGFTLGGQLTATLYNEEKIDAARTLSLEDSNAAIVQRRAFNGRFGKSDESGLTAIDDVKLKEFRLWLQDRDQEQIFSNRHQQLDPTATENSNLVHYLRMGQVSKTITNFARFNPNYEFQDSLNDDFTNDATITGDYEYSPDNISWHSIVTENGQDTVIEKYLHHTICPIGTFFVDQSCYISPVNELLISVFPEWRENERRLYWKFQLMNSSFIQQDLLATLTQKWSSPNSFVLDYAFEQFADEQSYIRPIHQDFLKNEGNHQVKVELIQPPSNFLYESKLVFIPQSCQWFEKRQTFQANQEESAELIRGESDIVYDYVLFKNPDFSCDNLTFYDLFYSMEFKWLLRDSVEYVRNEPEMEWTLQNYVDSNGQQILNIRAILPKEEQHKLPTGMNVGLLMTLRWTSSQFSQIIWSGQESLSEDLKPVFQNLHETIRFSSGDDDDNTSKPIAIVDIVEGSTFVVEGESVTLSAESSYVTNMPVAMYEADLSYLWLCPPVLDSLCREHIEPTFTIEYADLAGKEILFGQSYEFTVSLQWASQETGELQRSEASTQVVWTSLTQFDFEIQMNPRQVLLTTPMVVSFAVLSADFDEDSLPEITWQFEPEMRSPTKRVVSESGSTMTLESIYLDEQTVYTVTVAVRQWDHLLPDATKTLTFETYAPPSGGSVTLSPQVAKLGDMLTIQCEDWVSSRLPIVYNAWSTSDFQGSDKSTQINQNGPVPISRAMRFEMTNANPVIVEISDLSGEFATFMLFVILSPDFNSSNFKETPVTTKLNDFWAPNSNEEWYQKHTDTRVLFDQADADLDRQLSFEEFKTFLTLEIEQQEGAEDLLEALDLDVLISSFGWLDSGDQNGALDWGEIWSNVGSSKSNSGSDFLIDEPWQPTSDSKFKTNSKIGLMSKVQEITGVGSQEDFEKLMNDSQNSLNLIYESLLSHKNSEMNNTVKILENNALQTVFEALSVHESLLNQDLIQLSMQVLDEMQSIKGYSNLLQGTQGAHFTRKYMECLEKVNKFTQQNNLAQNKAWVNARVQKQADSVCEQLPNGEIFNYDGEGQIGLSVGQFNKASSLDLKTLQALDSKYQLDMQSIMEEIPNFTGTLCAQFFSINSFEKQPNIEQYSRGQVQLSLFKRESGEHFKLDSLVNLMEVDFAMSPTTYVSNQTICVDQELRAESCMTALIPETFTIKCVCSVFKANQISLVTDYSREIGSKVPEFEQIKVKELSNIQENDYQIFQYVAFTWMSFIFATGLVASLILNSMDSQDSQNLNVQEHRSTATIQFLQNVSATLNEPLESVKMREQDLLSYNLPWNKSAFANTLYRIHPSLSPFTSFRSSVTRLVRFSAHLLQTNLVLLFLYPVFMQNKSEDQGIYFGDVYFICQVTLMSQVLMLPVVSEPIIWMFEHKNEQLTSLQNLCQRLFVVFAQVASLAVCSLVALNSGEVSLRNQYCFVFSTFLSLFISNLGTNVLRVWINSSLAGRRKAECLIRALTASEAEKVLIDMKAVQTADCILNKLNDTTQPTMVDQMPIDLTTQLNIFKPKAVSSDEKACVETEFTKEVTLEEEVEPSAKPQSRSEFKPRRGGRTELDDKDAQTYATQ